MGRSTACGRVVTGVCVCVCVCVYVTRTCKALQFPCTRLLVQPLGVSLLTDLDRHLHTHMKTQHSTHLWVAHCQQGPCKSDTC